MTIMLPTGKAHVSYSEIKDWMDCSFRHKLKYVKKIDMFKPNTNLVFGTAMHSAIEHYVKTKTVDLGSAKKILDDAWEVNKDNEDFKKNNKEEFLNTIGNMLLDLPIFLDETFKGWELVQTEENLMEDFAPLFEKHAGLSLKGFVDCVLKVPAKKKGEWLYWIIDWKSTARPWTKVKLQDQKVTMQLVLYKKFWADKHKVPIKSIRCGFVTMLKKAKPGKFCRLIAISVGEVSINKSLIVINNSLTSIKRGMAIKNRNSCRFCDYKDTEHCT